MTITTAARATAPGVPVPAPYIGYVPDAPSAFRDRLIYGMQAEDFLEGECWARGATCVVKNRQPQAVTDALKSSGIRRDFWDLLVVTYYRGRPEPYFIDAKSQLTWVPRLTWNINCTAIYNAWHFRESHSAREIWFGLILHGGGTPYMVRLEDVVSFSHHVGTHAENHCAGYWQIDAAEANLPTLDFLLGPRIPNCLPPQQIA
jgi:hypothetical protein